MMTAIRDILVPVAKARRDRIMKETKARAEEAARLAPGAAAAAEAKRPRIILTFDGEAAHLNAALDIFVDHVLPAVKDEGFELMKFAASASKTQQPCDVSPSFTVLKYLFLVKKHGPTTAAYTDHVLSVLLAKMDSASKRSYGGFLGHLPSYLSAAFTHTNVAMGWAIAGLHPFNATLIMKRSTSWKFLPEHAAGRILASIPKLAEVAYKHGEVTDLELQATVGDAFNFDEWVAAEMHVAVKDRSVDKKVLNQRRVIWLNHEGVTSKRRKLEQDAAAAAAAKVATAAATQAKRAETKRKAEATSEMKAAAVAKKIKLGQKKAERAAAVPAPAVIKTKGGRITKASRRHLFS